MLLDRIRLTGLDVILLMLLSGGACYSESGDEGPVYTRREAVDDDFAFQGEYHGWQRSQASSRSSESIALQVIALGDGKFQVVKFYRGLPGAGWQPPEKFSLAGQRYSDRVALTGARFDGEILEGELRLHAPGGRLAGELRRIERVSPTLGAKPPRGAVVLYDGSDTSHWKSGQVTTDGLLQAGTETRESYGDFRLHGEFMLPYKPYSRGQDRGNSGFYLQSRYEVQVLDSFGLEGVENECGALYKTRRPDINLCLPPLQWQTYDIDFRSAQFDPAGEKVEDMRISIWHNGVPVHRSAVIPHKTGAGQPEGPEPLPLKLQGHGNPVVYRNLWLIDLRQPGAESIPWLKLPAVAEPVSLTIGL